jgi:predicted nucleotidyltransferase
MDKVQRMQNELVAELKIRNSRIIKAIIKKAEIVCPGSIALIGIGGSFCHGDIHERSDLDLCIVINDDSGWKIADCFILNEVGFDIYCTPWHRLEAMAEYTNPHVTKLLHLDIVYHADETAIARYLSLQKSVQDKLGAPFSLEDANHVTSLVSQAMNAYAFVMLGETAAECKYASAKMLLAIEYLIYLANKSYIQRGIRRIPEELRSMKRLPQHFWTYYQQLIAANSRDDIQACSTRFMKTVQAFVTTVNEPMITKKEITPEAVRGAYEEIVSNWRNKMHLAARTDDAYLALMTMASCQEFYDEFSTEYNVERVRLFEEFQIDDLARSAERFDAAMEYYRYLYTQVGEPVRSYSNIEEFEKAYLESE